VPPRNFPQKKWTWVERYQRSFLLCGWGTAFSRQELEELKVFWHNDGAINESIFVKGLIAPLPKCFNLCLSSRKVRADDIKILRIDPVGA
jgi:hypothetical protein